MLPTALTAFPTPAFLTSSDRFLQPPWKSPSGILRPPVRPWGGGGLDHRSSRNLQGGVGGRGQRPLFPYGPHTLTLTRWAAEVAGHLGNARGISLSAELRLQLPPDTNDLLTCISRRPFTMYNEVTHSTARCKQQVCRHPCYSAILIHRGGENHLEERLLDQARARAPYTPLFWGCSRSIPQGVVSNV